MVHTVYKNYWNLVKLCPGNLVRFLDTLILQMWLCGGGGIIECRQPSALNFSNCVFTCII